VTLIRVVDYVASPGGGCRFTAELLRALGQVTSARFEVVSFAHGSRTYRKMLGDAFPVREIPPANALRAYPPWTGIPGARLVNWVLHTPDFHFDVPARAFDDCDLVWLPWMQRHRIPWERADRVVATLHDLINVEFPGVVPETFRSDERKTLRMWFDSRARIAVDAAATIDGIERMFGNPARRPSIVPLSSEHSRPSGAVAKTVWPFEDRPFLLCPTNVSPHKNLDVLLEAHASWAARHPVVITGNGTDLWNHRTKRHRKLRAIIERGGLVRDRDVFALGYLDFPAYDDLLLRAWAVVIPTLAEGYGFPVIEAMFRGVPVIASDLPVLREVVARTGGEIIWFDPKSPDDLAKKIALLDARYADFRAKAAAQVGRLSSRSWDDVARDYALVLGLDSHRGEARRDAGHERREP
jgi:glycosyltransferase involved in cell wall biosynthesis